MKKVSIIVPVYNTEKYMRRCLDSLINQTLNNIEIIVIDDQSTDNSPKIIKEYAKKHKDKIKFINNKEKGIGKARNLGIEKATGEYISFIDSDDYVSTEMMDKCYRYAKNSNLDIVVCDFYKVYEESNKKEEITIEPFGITSLKKNRELLFKINASPWNKLYKRSLFKNKQLRFAEGIKYEDLAVIPLLLEQANKIGHLPEPLNYYLVRGKSQTTTMDDRVFDIFKVLDILNNHFSKKLKYKKELEYLNIEKIAIYNISQRYQKDKKLRNKFINQGFRYLDINYPNWRNNIYYKNRNPLKRFIEKNIILTKIYCSIYNTINNIKIKR